MKDNRLRTTLALLYGLDARVYVSSRIKKTSLFDCLGQYSDVNRKMFGELDVSKITRGALSGEQDKDIVCLTTRRLSLLKYILSRAGLNKMDEYFVLPSFDNPRWIVPAGIYDIGGMINPSSLKARVIVQLFKFCSVMHIGGLIFPHRIRRFGDENKNKKSILSDACSKLPKCKAGRVIYLGSFGPLQKTTVEYVGCTSVEYYAKISDNERTKQALMNEKTALEHLNKLSLSRVFVPKLVNFYSVENTRFTFLVQSSLKEVRQCLSITTVLSNAITEIHAKTLKRDFDSLSVYVRALGRSIYNKDKGKLNIAQRNALNISIDEYNATLNSLKNMASYMSFSHGDFTRWNIREDGAYAYIFDWEEAKYRSIGYDVFHFILVEHVLVDNKQSTSQYYEKISELFTRDESMLDGIFYDNEELMIFYLKLYLIYIIDVYLWHASIHHEESYPNKDNIDLILGFASNLIKYLNGHLNENNQ